MKFNSFLIWRYFQFWIGSGFERRKLKWKIKNFFLSILRSCLIIFILSAWVENGDICYVHVLYNNEKRETNKTATSILLKYIYSKRSMESLLRSSANYFWVIEIDLFTQIKRFFSYAVLNVIRAVFLLKHEVTYFN